MPKLALSIIKEFATRDGVGYQVLIKRWLEEKIAEEGRIYRDGVEALNQGLTPGKALRFPKTDTAYDTHYQYDKEFGDAG